MSLDLDSYADYPRSVNELRCARSGSAADWTPREILIQLLRDIDSGRVQPDALVTVYRESRDGSSRTEFLSSCADATVMVGLLEMAKLLMWRKR